MPPGQWNRRVQHFLARSRCLLEQELRSGAAVATSANVPLLPLPLHQRSTQQQQHGSSHSHQPAPWQLHPTRTFATAAADTADKPPSATTTSAPPKESPADVALRKRLTRLQLILECDPQAAAALAEQHPLLLLLGPYALRRLAAPTLESVFTGGGGISRAGFAAGHGVLARSEQASAAQQMLFEVAVDAPCTLQMRAMHWGERGLLCFRRGGRLRRLLVPLPQRQPPPFATNHPHHTPPMNARNLL